MSAGGLPPADRLLAGVDWSAVEREAMSLLSGLIGIDTTNPPGNEAPAAEYVARALERDGIPAEVLRSRPGRANVLARLPGAGRARPLLLLSHLDTVGAEGQDWQAPPASGVVHDNMLFGRGALDMKGPLVAHMVAFMLLRRLATTLARDVVLLSVADEEWGSDAGARYVLRHRPEVGMAEYVLGEGSFIIRDALRPGEDAWAVSCGEKGGLVLRVTARGRGGHGGLAQGNPHERLARALRRLADHRMPLVVTETMAEFFRRVAPRYPAPVAAALRRPGVWRRLRAAGLLTDPVTAPLLHDTAGVYGFECRPYSALPDTSSAVVGVRVMPGRSLALALREVESALADPDVSVEVLSHFEDRESPWDTPLFRAIEHVASGERDRTVALPIISPASSDNRLFRPLGAVCYGFVPFVVTREQLAGVHGPDERVAVPELREGVRRLLRIILELER